MTDHEILLRTAVIIGYCVAAALVLQITFCTLLWVVKCFLRAVFK